MADSLYIVNVEGAITRDGRYLLIVRGSEEDHAAGMLALVGGKVDDLRDESDALETTLRREILEEVAVEVGDMAYVYNNIFSTGADDAACLDVIFLCRYQAGEPTAVDPGEVANLLWLTVDEALKHPAAPPWLQTQLEHAEAVRQKLGW